MQRVLDFFFAKTSKNFRVISLCLHNWNWKQKSHAVHRRLLRFFFIPRLLYKTTREESQMSNYHTTLFKIVLYWCLDLIRHNIDTHLKYNKYIFDISIPFCHHFYLSATLKQCFTEFAVSSNVHSSQLRLIPYLHHTSSVLR
jgi:hypothetical protein